MTGWEWQEVWCAGWAVPCKTDFWFAEAEFRLGILKHLENKLYLIIVLLHHPMVVCRPRRLQGARAEAGDQLGGSWVIQVRDDVVSGAAQLWWRQCEVILAVWDSELASSADRLHVGCERKRQGDNFQIFGSRNWEEGVSYLLRKGKRWEEKTQKGESGVWAGKR